MSTFSTGRDAKEFLVAKIVEEASREGVSLSEIERKMLYFTETAWTLPDIMQVNAEFDRDYDQNEYEKKIAHLIKNAGERAEASSKEEYERFWSAIRRLKKEDHYILVMVNRSGLHPPGDFRRLWSAGLIIVLVFTLVIFVSIKSGIDLDKFLSRGGLGLLAWGVAACAAIVYVILRWTLGAKRTDALAARLVERIFNGRRREN